MRVRWMIRRDMPEVFAIEQQCFQDPWTEDEFTRYLSASKIIGVTAVDDDDTTVCGYMVYMLHKHWIEVLNIAVAPECRGLGVGSLMVDLLRSKLSVRRRDRLAVFVRESNLAAQLFFKSHGFAYVKTHRGYYPNSREDAYELEYLWDEGREVLASIWHGAGRVVKTFKGAHV